jgi:hypothetical protein
MYTYWLRMDKLCLARIGCSERGRARRAGEKASRKLRGKERPVNKISHSLD